MFRITSQEPAITRSWAQVGAGLPAAALAEAGSNPVAPTTSLRNLHNANEERELA
jgi:hypothetical protein